MPGLQKLYRRLEGQGLALITIHTKRHSEKMQQWMQDNGIDLPACVDTNDETVKAYAVDSYPDYYVIDRSGKLRVADLMNADVEATVTKLLAEPAPAKPDKASRDAVKATNTDAADVLAKARADAAASKRRIFMFPTADW